MHKQKYNKNTHYLPNLPSLYAIRPGFQEERGNIIRR